MLIRRAIHFLGILVLVSLLHSTVVVSAQKTEAEQALDLVSRSKSTRQEAINWFVERNQKDAIPALIQALRFSGRGDPEIVAALEQLSGEKAGTSWNDWMLWQEKNSDIKPFAGFDQFKSELYEKIDPRFVEFIFPGVKHEIRLSEIAWGGVRKDGIPALTNPKLIDPKDADYLTEDELIFGVSINGDARAYPLRILDWHEMFNDVIGGVPVSLAYCTLCGSGILFETTVEGRDKPFVFGSSGFLFRSNKLMYDQQTHSLWNQFTGRPVVGALTGSGIELKTRPVAITSWADWLKANPKTRVISLETGYDRDYEPGKPYGPYFSSPELMFPAVVDETKLKAKDYVFALRSSGMNKAWPLELFKKSPVINDTAGVISLTLVGNSKTRTVRAYRTEGEIFKSGDDAALLMLDGKTWRVSEDALRGPEGKTYNRLPGHIAYWFAWSGYLGGTGEVAGTN